MFNVPSDGSWEKNLKAAMVNKEKELRALIEKRNEKRREELRIVRSIEDVVTARLNTFIDMFEADEELGMPSSPSIETTPYTPPEPTGGEDELNISRRDISRYPHNYDVELVMPELTDVTAANLLFRTEIRSQRKRGVKEPVMTVFLRAYHKYSESKLDQKNNLRLPYKVADTAKIDAFVKKRIVKFVEAWYTRKIAEEMDKEREYKVRIVHKSI